MNEPLHCVHLYWIYLSHSKHTDPSDNNQSLFAHHIHSPQGQIKPMIHGTVRTPPQSRELLSTAVFIVKGCDMIVCVNVLFLEVVAS